MNEIDGVASKGVRCKACGCLLNSLEIYFLLTARSTPRREAALEEAAKARKSVKEAARKFMVADR